MSTEDVTTDDAWSADDPPVEPGDSAADSEGDPPERGTRAERRSQRDQSTRDENVRTERDEARSRAEQAETALSTMRDSMVRERVAEHLANPDDLRFVMTDEERAQLWHEDGSLDEGALAAAIDRVLEQRPHWRRPRYPSGGMDLGAGGAVGRTSGTRSVGWADVLRGNVG